VPGAVGSCHMPLSLPFGRHRTINMENVNVFRREPEPRDAHEATEGGNGTTRLGAVSHLPLLFRPRFRNTRESWKQPRKLRTSSGSEPSRRTIVPESSACALVRHARLNRVMPAPVPRCVPRTFT